MGRTTLFNHQTTSKESYKWPIMFKSEFKILNFSQTDFSSKVHVRMMYRHTLCSHYTTYTEVTSRLNHFLCILTIPPAATCPEINGNSKHTRKKLHPTWWVSSLFCNLQTSIQTNNHNSSNSDYSCSVNFSDRIVTLTSVCNVCRPQFKWITTNHHTLIFLVLFTSTIDL